MDKLKIKVPVVIDVDRDGNATRATIELAREIEPGDIVRLNSGGPKMTVRAVGAGVVCNWFNGYELVEERFRITSLTRT